MVSIELEIKSAKLSEALEHAPADIRLVLRRDVMLPALAAHESIIKRSQFRPYRGASFGDRLQRRSGALANAYAVTLPPVQGPLGGMEGFAGIRSGVKGSQYAKIQEFGGTVKPKHGKYLTIPTKEALTPAGVLKGKYRIRKSGSGYVTDAGQTFLFKSKGGNLLIGVRGEGRRKSSAFIGPIPSRAKAKGGELTAIYVLRRSVKIPARLGFFDAWRKLERKTIPALMDRAIARALAFRAAAGGVK